MASRNRENNDTGRSDLRNAAQGKPGNGLRPKQYGCRLDIGEAGRPGINVLRIGNPTRVNDKMLSFTYERRFESHPDYSELWGIRKAIREIQSSFRKKSHSEKDTARNRLSRLRFRATELEVQIDADLFSEARVIACTLVGSANRVLTNHNFTTLFIDEAAQALEAACWIAISKADRVILAGDHHQLPPTIKCIEATRGGLDRTLMQKVAAGKPETVSLLKVQ